MEEVLALLQQLAQANQVSVEEVKQDLQHRIDEAWEQDGTESSAALRHFFKDQKPCGPLFLFALNQLLSFNDQIQEIIEEFYLEEKERGSEPSIEVSSCLQIKDLEDPIQVFLATLHCLKCNHLIFKTIRQMNIQDLNQTEKDQSEAECSDPQNASA